MRRQAGATLTLVGHSRESRLPDWPGSHSSSVPRQIQRTSRTKKKSSSHGIKKELKEEYSNQESTLNTNKTSLDSRKHCPAASHLPPQKKQCSHGLPLNYGKKKKRPRSWPRKYQREAAVQRTAWPGLVRAKKRKAHWSPGDLKSGQLANQKQVQATSSLTIDQGTPL